MKIMLVFNSEFQFKFLLSALCPVNAFTRFVIYFQNDEFRMANGGVSRQLRNDIPKVGIDIGWILIRPSSKSFILIGDFFYFYNF